MRSELPLGWRLVHWGEVAKLAYGKALRERSDHGPVTIYGTNGPTGWTDRKLGDGPTVVIGRKGAYRGVHLAQGPFWVIDTAFFLIPCADVDITWAYYELLTHDINGLDSGSAIPSTRREDFYAMPLRLPPLREQKRIAALLAAVDEKIDSNRRLAALLEETAATLFRARFVDFVGIEDFEESEIGCIPRGWRAGSLTDLARFVNGKAFTKYANGEGRPIIRIRELNGGVDDTTPSSDIDAVDDYLARDDDILFAWSGSLGAYRWSGPEALINQHIFKVLPERWPSWFVYSWIKRHMEDFRAIARDKATTMGHIQRRHLKEARLPQPDDAAIAEARHALDPIDEQRARLVGESRTLRELRDALVPKLISGEIRVPDTTDAAEVIEPAGAPLASAS